MKSGIDKKFDSLRNAPTEFSREQMESIIKGLPTAPAAPLDTTNWTSWFSLNNLLIVAFVGALGAGLLLWNKMPEQSDVLTVNEVEAQMPPVTMDNTPATVDAESEVSEKTADNANKSKEPSLDQSIAATKADAKPKKTVKVIEQPKLIKRKVELFASESSEPKINSEVKPTTNPESIPEDILVKEQERPEKNISKSGLTVVQQPKTTDPNTVPDLTNGEMRRLKKNLFKNLLDDKLIINTWKAVEIDLPGNEIIVNGKVIDQSLFNKYSLLTEKVGWGPDRKIKFDDEYIKVGDFTATGFRGSGFGTFRSTPKRHKPDEGISEESLVLKKKREIKKEQRELDAFAQTLLDTSVGKRKGRRNIMEANLKQKKCEKLHKELYENLLEDGLIEKKYDYVLIEISKNRIHINVLELNEVLYEKYSELFDSYKIKAGPRRQIRMSEHTIRVGDFSRGSFTGTSLILN